MEGIVGEDPLKRPATPIPTISPRELRERLDDGDEEEADFADRPIGELVARICKDLGITPDWSLLEDEDWAIEEARTRPPGSPFAAAPGVEGSGEGSSDPPWPAHDPPGGSSH